MPKMEVHLEIWNQWVNEEHKFVLYDEPLGGDHAVFQFWHSIAISLGLPLITGIYNHGLSIRNESDLHALEQELDQLEQYWRSHPLKDSLPNPLSQDELMVDLWERMEYFRKAIQIAKKNNAELSVQ